MSTFTKGHLCLPSDNAVAHNGALFNLATSLVDANFVTVACQDWGAWIPGSSLFALAESTNAYLYDFGFNLLHTVACGSSVNGLTSDYSSVYYATIGTTPATVSSVSTAGAIVTTRTLAIAGSKISGTAISQGGTFYYGVEGDPTSGSIKRFNFPGNAGLSDLVTRAFPAATNQSWVCLPSGDRAGDLLVASTPDITPTNAQWYLERWTPGGTLALSITLPPISDASGALGITISTDPTYPNTFWVRTFPNSTTHTISQYSLNGTIVQTFTLTTTANPNSPATSCPIFGWSQDLTPAPPGPPFTPDTVTPVQVGTRFPNQALVRVRQVGVPAFPGNLTQFIGRAEVQMQPGMGVPADPTVPPVVAMAWSGDNALTFNTEQPLSLGREGAYYTRAYKHVVGSMRQPACKLTCSDDVTFVPTDLFITREPGIG